MPAEVALLLGLSATAVALVAAILLCGWWHSRRADRAARLELTITRLLKAWAVRHPTPEEIASLAGLSPPDRRVLLVFCIKALPDLEKTVAEQARDALRASGLLHREVVRLRHRSPVHRAEACRTLGRLGQADAIPLLIERLRDRDWAVRREAIGALADLRAVEAVGEIADAIETMGEWGNLLPVMALVRMGPESVPAIARLLEHPKSPAMTKALLQVTGRLGVARDLPLVRALAAHADPEIRVEALRVLGSTAKDPESTAACIRAMDDPEWPARALAAWALGRLRDERAIPRLEQAMGDSAYWVRQHVADALAELGEAGEAALGRGLQHDNPFVRDMSTQALFMRSLRREHAA